MAQRYTLSHLAHDVKNQTGLGEPARDWFPLSFISTFSDWSDLVHGPEHQWGQLSCGCHPNCGVGMAVMVDKETKESAPVTSFWNADQLAKDVARVNDAARGKWLSIIGMALAAARNYDPFKSPTHFKLSDLMKKLDKTFGATGKNYGKVGSDRTMRISRSAAATAGTSCSSPACGSRICSTTISAAPSSASSPTPRRKARSPSAPTTPASAGATSSRRCT
jgi:7,8-dihydro-6-hydroxymethylpterin dimethyltransferase